MINEILSFKSEIFAINTANGFWEMGVENRSFGEHIALVSSEVAEALEADRKDLMDDKLPEYSGIAVELADVVIRVLDHTEANKVPFEKTDWFCEYNTFSEFAAELGLLISYWYLRGRKDVFYPSAIIENIVDYCENNNIPLIEIIEKKNAVNKARGYKHGGKKF